MSEAQVTGTQDGVAAEIDADIVTEGFVNINPCQDTEAFGIQGLGDFVNDGIKTDVDVNDMAAPIGCTLKKRRNRRGFFVANGSVFLSLMLPADPEMAYPKLANLATAVPLVELLQSVVRQSGALVGVPTRAGQWGDGAAARSLLGRTPKWRR